MIVIRWIIYLAVWAWVGKTLLYSEAFEEWFNSLHPFAVVALLVVLVRFMGRRNAARKERRDARRAEKAAAKAAKAAKAKVIWIFIFPSLRYIYGVFQ